HRRPHAVALARCEVEQLLALICAVRHETAVIEDLKAKISSRRERAASVRAAAGRKPSFLLRHGIPCGEHSSAALSLRHLSNGAHRRRNGQRSRAAGEGQSKRLVPRSELKVVRGCKT